LLTPDGAPTARYAKEGVPAPILAYSSIQDLELSSFASAEAQVAAIADDIAYDAHDIDDGLRAGLFELADIAAVPLVGAILADIDVRHSGLEESRRIHEIIRRVITQMIEDAAAESRRRLTALAPRTAEDIRRAPNAVIAFSPAMTQADKDIKGFLYPRMYRHAWVMRVMREAEQVVRDLFGHFGSTPSGLPEEWRAGIDRMGESGRARRIADYIAGMTDRYALIEHARYFTSTPELR
jgi:dGTPase